MLDFETTVSKSNGVAMCCGHVMLQHMGTPLDFELLSQCSMVWPCVVEMWCSCYGYVLDFETTVSMFNGVAMCCQMWTTHGYMLNFEQQLKIQHRTHNTWTCDVDNTWVHH